MDVLVGENRIIGVPASPVGPINSLLVISSAAEASIANPATKNRGPEMMRSSSRERRVSPGRLLCASSDKGEGE
jgi:hypothetical protein